MLLARLLWCALFRSKTLASRPWLRHSNVHHSRNGNALFRCKNGECLRLTSKLDGSYLARKYDKNPDTNEKMPRLVFPVSLPGIDVLYLVYACSFTEKTLR